MMYNCPEPFNCSNDPLGPSLVDVCQTPQFVVFLSLLNQLVLSNEIISGRCERIKPIATPDDEYDFVVIGGGSGGSVVAERLSENPEWKVLLLEAGSDEPAGSQVPLFTEGFEVSSLSWNYTSINESYACLDSNGSCSLNVGRMLGGSTAYDAMFYFRGIPKDYDIWADQGNLGWTWKEVEPFFKKGEDNGEIERVGSEHHGTGGPLSVERFPYQPPLGGSIITGVTEAGYQVVEDLNGGQTTGFTTLQMTNKNGVRRSSARAYLWPARNRENLHVSLNSQATRVIIKNDTAVGVEYYKDGQLKRVSVSREVVLSAGTIESPHILMLSGIGPKDHLESMGIEVVKDLPGVGENYHDHVAMNIDFTINEPDGYDNDYDIVGQYFANQTGPLSALGLVGLVGRIGTESASNDFPNVQVTFNGYLAACAPGDVGALETTGRRTIIIEVINLHPKSKGRISLASKNPFENPVIWSNALSVDSDLEDLVEAIELVLALADTEAFRARNFTLSSKLIKACSNLTFASTEYWACASRHSQILAHHGAGTCKMGSSSDLTAVVDPRLRVYGINGLRLADTSIMPQVTSGSTAAPTMMIGERAADFIKKDWALRMEEELDFHL